MKLPAAVSSWDTEGNKRYGHTEMAKKSRALNILNFVKALGETTTVTGIKNALGLNPDVIKATLGYLKRKGYVKQTYEDYFTYAGRFVRFGFSTGGETRVGSISKREVLEGYDAFLEPEKITITNLIDEEFTVTFTLVGIESAELVRRFAFVVDEETDKKLMKICHDTPNVLTRPILEKKAFSFDRLPPRQTRKYCLEFLVDREFMEKVPRNELKCTLKMDCISLNYHDFAEITIRLAPGWIVIKGSH